jgi:hypothetical protein
MGLIGTILGTGPAQMGAAVGGLAEVFVGNRAERDAAEAAQGQAALSQFTAEFQQAPTGRFDRFMNGLNRLPRPLLVGGTLGLFAYAMIAPDGFARRMDSLALVPEPLWWLLGAIVSFYFGSRELHYARNGVTTSILATGARAARTTSAPEDTDETADTSRPFLSGLFTRAKATPPVIAVKAADPNFNAAIEEWLALRR